ncbi:fumarylacetoacetate hydrolase family protein [Microbacterium immunditiarum]|uniref:2-keto-4-pentenoate hydratase/2-oxohepta-3-ene-1,7-dioic acid hydratase in catechol pathway n=1 Tax=Microbacterium immunditiarum TaxID=337480 RepID=A0A7Y9GM13_9MICO|nr:fumarylacetoacetate hydrolase family protein [Microbacterium immunditiarum]NYE18988.1 2-keto-4-pentenoate hydratase/2-oxohepta-3-ene-1,7-dioic acid hydratase in catechol pathway [Microbacterium immunditiarum]
MRWVTYDGGDGVRTGIVDEDSIRGLGPGVDLLSLVELGASGLAEAGASARRSPHEVRRLEDVRLLAPLPRPTSMRDGLCFLDHLRNARRALRMPGDIDPAWLDGPGFYFTNAGAVLGPYDDVAIAAGSRMFDLELEVGAVIGAGGRDLHPARAEKHIIGYTLFNDWTARDHQMRDFALGIGMGKSKDAATTLGPALITADELEPLRDGDGRLSIELAASVNGRELTRGNLALMDWTFGELLAYISRGVDLAPGDVIGSGTVPGGCLLEHVDGADPAEFTWLSPGDVVSLWGGVLGETRQTVVPGVDVTPLRLT